MSKKHTEQEFTGSIRDDFETSLHHLDGDITGRLAAIRARALAGRRSAYRAWLQVPAAALLVISLAIASYHVLVSTGSARSYTPDDIELLTTLDSLDLYNDEEFYEWLDDQGTARQRSPENG